MKKMSLLGLLASSLLLSATSCSDSDSKADAMTVEPLTYPAPVDTTAGNAEAATREINAVNATESIKRMQPVM